MAKLPQSNWIRRPPRGNARRSRAKPRDTSDPYRGLCRIDERTTRKIERLLADWARRMTAVTPVERWPAELQRVVDYWAAADGVYVLPEGQRRLAAWIHQCQAAEYQRQQHEAAGALDHVQIDLLTPDAALNAEAAANAALTTVLAFDPLNTLSAPEQHLARFYDVEALRTRAEQSKQVKRTSVAEEYLHDYHYAVAEGHFQPSWYQQAVVFAWGLLVPNPGPRRAVEYADGTVSVELAAEPDTGFLAGQASSMAGMGAAAGSGKTLAGKMAIAGRELLEEGIESAIQYVSGLPIPLVRPSRGSTRPRVESGKVPDAYATNTGKLVFDPATKSWTSPGGLVYGQGSPHGNRVKHVLDHLVPNPNKATHSIFNVDRTKLIGLLDDAWTKKVGPGVLQPNGNRVWTVDMGRVIGTSGERHIQLVIRDGTTNVITAFPKLVP